MRLLLLTLSFPAVLFSQEVETVASLSSRQNTITNTVTPADSMKKDSLNVTDASGKKQGHWIILGGEVPNSGVGSTELLEQGDYRDNERTGIWMRYGAKGEVKSVMRYVIDPKTKTSVRDQFYHYSYFPNGKIQRKPEIGECPSASNYSVYDESGNLTEAEIFDKDCNTTLKLQRIGKNELDSIELFKPAYKFAETADRSQQNLTVIQSFGQTGEFCVDYLHRLFQIGTFANGILTEGREIEVDDMMRPQKVRYISGGKIVKVAMR